MRSTLRKTHHALLAVISFLVSRSLFLLVDDPEGPNLLIVTVLALAIYAFLLMLLVCISYLKNRRGI